MAFFSEIKARLGLDITPFEKGLSQAQGSLGKVVDGATGKLGNFRTLGTTIATALGLNLQTIAEGVARMVVGFSKDQEDALLKLAARSAAVADEMEKRAKQRRGDDDPVVQVQNLETDIATQRGIVEQNVPLTKKQEQDIMFSDRNISNLPKALQEIEEEKEKRIKASADANEKITELNQQIRAANDKIRTKTETLNKDTAKIEEDARLKILSIDEKIAEARAKIAEPALAKTGNAETDKLKIAEQANNKAKARADLLDLEKEKQDQLTDAIQQTADIEEKARLRILSTDERIAELRAKLSKPALDVAKIEAPKIEVPKIEAPKIEAPKIEAPKIEAPKIKVPKIEAPKIEVPKIKAPKIEAPKIEAPKIEVPKIKVPKIEAPKIEVPKIEVPKIEAPKIEAPKIEVPKIEAPKIEAPKIEVPKIEAPKIKVPKIEVPKIEAPKIEVPKIEVPKIEAPKIEVPKIKVPKIEAPKIEVPKIKVPKIEAPKIEVPKIEVPKIEAPKIEVPKIKVPKIEAPKIEVPKIEVPQIKAPKIEVPKIKAAKIEAPKIEAPKIEVPKIEVPKIEVPKIEVAKIKAPKIEAPKIEVPKIEAPKIEAPKIEVPKIEEPKIEVPKIKAPKIEVPKIEAPKIEAAKIEAPKIEAPELPISGDEGKSELKIKQQSLETAKDQAELLELEKKKQEEIGALTKATDKVREDALNETLTLEQQILLAKAKVYDLELDVNESKKGSVDQAKAELTLEEEKANLTRLEREQSKKQSDELDAQLKKLKDQKTTIEQTLAAQAKNAKASVEEIASGTRQVGGTTKANAQKLLAARSEEQRRMDAVSQAEDTLANGDRGLTGGAKDAAQAELDRRKAALAATQTRKSDLESALKDKTSDTFAAEQVVELKKVVAEIIKTNQALAPASITSNT